MADPHFEQTDFDMSFDNDTYMYGFGELEQYVDLGPDVSHALEPMAMATSAPVIHHYYDEPGPSTWMPTHNITHGNEFSPSESFVSGDMQDPSCLHAEQQQMLDETMTVNDSAIEVHPDKSECPVCHKILCKKGVAKHVSRVHKKEEYTISCTQCGKTFFSRKDLQDHISSHPELREKIYICPKHGCPRRTKGYTRPDNALRHVQQKHPELIKFDANGEVIKGGIKFECVPYRRD